MGAPALPGMAAPPGQADVGAGSPAAGKSSRSVVPGLDDVVPASGAAATPAGGSTTWASISGLEAVKRLLQEATVLPTLRPDLFTVRAWHGVAW